MHEPYRTRVAAFRAHLDRLTAFASAHDAMARGDYATASAHGRKMLEAVDRVADSSLLVDRGPITRGSASGAGVVEMAERIGRYANGPKGRLVTVFPREARFRLDPNPEGVVNRWYSPDLSEAGWRTVRTDAGWESQADLPQGSAPYTGAGWYRCAVQVPEREARGPLRLLIPAFRGNSVTVWCNGAFLDRIDNRQTDESVLDLAGHVRPGRNLFAFRVAGGQWGGGLLLPPFLFVPAGE